MRVTRIIQAMLLLGPVMLACLASVRADDVQPLNARQIEIASTVTDDLINRLKALMPQYPELAKFGHAPEFTRSHSEFRYDYRVEKVPVAAGEVPQERPLPGGCIIYFRLYPASDSPMLISSPPELKDYSSGSSWGGERAGIGRLFSFLLYQKSYHDHVPYDDRISATLNQTLMNVVNQEFETTFAQLTSEYDLARQGIGLDVPSLLAAAERQETNSADHPFETISENAFIALRFHKLTSEQLAQIRQGFHDGKYPLRSAWNACEIIEKQDSADLPGFLTDLIASSLKVERTGSDTFHLTPFTTFDPWSSDAGEARGVALAALQDGDLRYLPVAALLLSSDSMLDHRIDALDYIAKQPGDDAQKLILGALANSYRSVQAHAAEIAGGKKLTAAEPGLRALLASSAPKVRTAAVAAVKKLGFDVPVPPALPLPDSPRQITATLWNLGLNQDDFIKNHVLISINTPLLPAFDDASVRKVIDTYAAADDRHPLLPWNQPVPAPFLLAAALKFQDEEAARRIYGYLCDNCETDDSILSDALNDLGWNRFAEGLNEFHLRHDDAALSHLAQVAALSSVAKSFSLLSVYIKESNELTNYLKTRPPETASPEPDRSETATYVKYWIGQLKDCDGSTPSPVGEKIRQIGLPALPYLIDAITDRTPTRNFSYWRSYMPERDFIYVGNAATTILDVIARDYGLNPPGTERGSRAATLAAQEKLRAWLKGIPPDAQLLPPKKRPPELLHPAGRYFWGDD